MESYILLKNSYYKEDSEILFANIKNLLNELNIDYKGEKSIVVDEKFLPFFYGSTYYLDFLATYLSIIDEGNIPIFCDSQMILSFKKMLFKLQNDGEFREEMSKKLNREVNILELEKYFTLLPQILLESLAKSDKLVRKWSGFTCAFVLDRELEQLVLDLHLADRFQAITGVKLRLFFKESYDYLLHTNKNLAFKMASRDYYEIVDSGVDFITTPNLGMFHIFDGYSKDLQKSAGRDDLEIPVLLIPQVILAMFEDMDFKKLLFFKHKITPKML